MYQRCYKLIERTRFGGAPPICKGQDRIIRGMGVFFQLRSELCVIENHAKSRGGVIMKRAYQFEATIEQD